MPKKVKKKASIVYSSKPKIDELPNVAEETGKLHQLEQHCLFNNVEVERRSAAIKAVCAAETENLLSRLRLLRLYLTKEQLEVPALHFIQENLPNLTAIPNVKYPIFELQWTNDEGCLPGNHDDYSRASIGNALNTPAFRSLQFSANSAKTSILETANLCIPDLNFQELSRDSLAGSEAFETPGAIGHRLSFGMTPKTSRAPKNGEMLLSVHGSPLGVFKEEHLAAIHESGDGSNGDAN